MTGVQTCALPIYGRQTALVLISLNPQPVKSTVTLPNTLAGPWTDAESTESILGSGAAARVALEAFQVRVLTFER